MSLPRTNAVVLGAALLLFGAGGPWLYTHLRSLPGTGALAARSTQRIVTLAVDGAERGAAADAVEAALKAVPGVTAAEVRPAQSRAYVVCTRDVADSALVAAVRASGPGRGARIVQQ